MNASGLHRDYFQTSLLGTVLQFEVEFLCPKAENLFTEGNLKNNGTAPPLFKLNCTKLLQKGRKQYLSKFFGISTIYWNFNKFQDNFSFSSPIHLRTGCLWRSHAQGYRWIPRGEIRLHALF